MYKISGDKILSPAGDERALQPAMKKLENIDVELVAAYLENLASNEVAALNYL